MLLIKSDMCTFVSICIRSFSSGPSGTICFFNGFEHFNYHATRCVFSVLLCSFILFIWLLGSVGLSSLLWLKLSDIVPPKTVSRPWVFSGASVTHVSGLSVMCYHSMGSAKERSKYWTIVLTSHASKVMLKILQARLYQYLNWKLPDVQLDLEKTKEPEIELPTFVGS